MRTPFEWKLQENNLSGDKKKHILNKSAEVFEEKIMKIYFD